MKIFNSLFINLKLGLFMISLFVITHSIAQNVYTETFNYSLNSTLTSNGYTAHSGAGTNAITVTDTALIFAGYDLSGTGRSIKIDTTGEDVHHSFTTISSGSVYAAYLVKVTKAKTAGDYFLHFGLPTIGTTFFTRVFVKADATDPTLFAFGLSKAGAASAAAFSGFTYKIDTTYLVVVSYSIVSGTANDSVTMWINPTANDFSNPSLSAPDLTATDRATIGTIAFRQGSSSSAPQVQLSGLKIDTLWSNLFGTPTPTVATPTFSATPGVYHNDTSVAISCTTAGATIYYTTDGSNPTNLSLVYSAPISLNSTKTIKAAAYFTGLDSSAIASATYSFVVATPTANPAAGTYPAIQNVNLSCATMGANIYYTIDGTVPTNASTLYTTAISIDSSLTLKYAAYKTGYDSSMVGTEIYVINIVAVNAPQFSLSGGTYYSDQTVTLTTTTLGAAIYYTTNGIDPNSASALYSSPITVNQNTILKAIAILGNDSSAISSEVYVMKVDTVISNLAAGNYTASQLATLTNSTPGATIYYTIDGTTPTIGSLQYSTPIQIANSLTLKAIAFKTNWENSVESSWNYIISTPPPSLPLVDTFAYGLNSLLTDNGYSAHSGSGFNSIKVSGSALNYTNYLYSNAGNSILIDTTGEDVNRTFIPLTSGSVYVAFLVNVSKATTDGEYFFHLGNDVLSTNFRGKVFAKSSNPGFVQFGVSKGSNTATYSQDYALNTTHLIVLKYHLDPTGSSDDSAMIWINPHINSIQNPDVICSDLTGSDLINIGTYAFRQGSGVKAARLTLSGFVMDTDWNNIMTGLIPVLQAPTVSTSGATNIGIHSATLNGNVSFDGNTPIIERGFIYSSQSNLTFNDSVVMVNNGGGLFSATVQSLSANQLYYYQAYAINAIDTSYGAVQSFSTLVDGMNENELVSIQYFPNPVNDLLMVYGAANSQIRIYSLMGVEVFNAELIDNESNIDLSQLSSGVYLVAIRNAKGLKSFKIIKN